MSSVLVLTRELPYPLEAGDRIVTFGFLRCLAAQGHDVHVLSYERDDDATAMRRVSRVCSSVRRVPRDQPRLPTPIVKATRRLTGRSHVMAMFDRPAFRDAASRRVREIAPDVVLAEHPYMGQCFLDDRFAAAVDATAARTVTNAHVVEYAAHQRLQAYGDGLRNRVDLALEIPPLRRRELAIYDRSTRTMVLGEADRAELHGGVSGPIVTQRVGIDPGRYETAKPRDTTPGRLVFFGSFDWFPNEDGIRTFCTEVFPRLRDDHPDVELVIAGRGMTDRVAALGRRPNVRTVGRVDDLGSLVRSAAVTVVPIRVGGGIRIKVLESMAWGVPVVATGPGSEGVDASAGEDLFVADSWREFARTIENLLESPRRRYRVARRARQTIEERYALDAVGPQLEENLGIGRPASAADR